MITIEPFAQKHIQDAAQLFATRYRSQRARNRTLPVKYGEPETIARLLEGITGRHPGVVAISGTKLAGYLTGFAGIPDFKGISPGVYTPEWGHSAESGPAGTLQSMYETIARDWTREGWFSHAITFFPSETELRDLLYWNGFGLLVVDAIRGLDQGDPQDTDEPGSGFAVRAANEGDLEDLARLDRGLETYLSHSPCFLFRESGHEPDTAEEFLGKDTISVVAERDNQVVACIRGRSVHSSASTIVRDDSLMGIDFAFTDPGVRGVGLGTKILAQLLDWGRSEGKIGCAVDFESANALARAFWLRHFQVVCCSAIRHVDPKLGRDSRGQE